MNKQFRVWSAEVNGFLPQDDIAIMNNGAVLIYDWHNDGGKSWGHSFDHHTIQQFTGNFDINSVGIYEGDIVKILNSSYSKEEYWNPVYIIGKNYWSFTTIHLPNLGGLSIDNRDFIIRNYSPDRVEVIGNIFENPDIL
jgi:uncharacterized phage protein (TIGR01671 family)